MLVTTFLTDSPPETVGVESIVITLVDVRVTTFGTRFSLAWTLRILPNVVVIRVVAVDVTVGLPVTVGLMVVVMTLVNVLTPTIAILNLAATGVFVVVMTLVVTDTDGVSPDTVGLSVTVDNWVEVIVTTAVASWAAFMKPELILDLADSYLLRTAAALGV